MLFVYSIYDSAAQVYQSPFAVANKGAAMREFIDACNNKETFLAKHPADYTLFLLGTFDDLSGTFNMEITPVRVGTAIEFVKSPASPETIRNSVNMQRGLEAMDDQGCSRN